VEALGELFVAATDWRTTAEEDVGNSRVMTVGGTEGRSPAASAGEATRTLAQKAVAART
jgi:hypothetical protein